MTSLLTIERKNILLPSSIEEFVSLFSEKFARGKQRIQFTGISGRILRGKTDYDFLSLTDNPDRKVVFLLDGTGLGGLIGLNGREVLEEIGYPKYYIDVLVQQKTKFKLAVLPENAVKVATWDNLLTIVSGAYPEWQQKIDP